MTRPPIDGTRFRAEVLVRGEVNWASNALRFGSSDNALSYAMDLSGRWTAVARWRAGATTARRPRGMNLSHARASPH